MVYFSVKQNTMYKIVVAITGTLFFCFCACTVKMRNVLMTPRLEEPGVVKIYFDREGDLYPPEVHLNPYYFYLQHLRKKEKGWKKNEGYATVEESLTRTDSLSKAYIRQKYQLTGPDSIRLFLRLQQTLRKNYVARIEKLMEDNNHKQVVVLIHGFNDPQPDAYYFSLRRSINEKLKGKAVFVEVYWDGLTDMGDNPIVASIWGKARPNSAKVGLGLRNVLNKLNVQTSLTIITHSLGASVATHALFNPLRWPKTFQEKLDEDYRSSKIATPQLQNITLAMLAPAIPGTTTFNHINNTVPEKSPLHLKRLIIGYNHFDYAVTKGGLFARSFGSTALGADAKKEVDKTFKVIKDKAPDILCTGVDFSYSDTSKLFKQKGHGVLFYEQSCQYAAFINAVFD